jgi:hypothetical protein
MLASHHILDSQENESAWRQPPFQHHGALLSYSSGAWSGHDTPELTECNHFPTFPLYFWHSCCKLYGIMTPLFDKLMLFFRGHVDHEIPRRELALQASPPTMSGAWWPGQVTGNIWKQDQMGSNDGCFGWWQLIMVEELGTWVFLNHKMPFLGRQVAGKWSICRWWSFMTETPRWLVKCDAQKG